MFGFIKKYTFESILLLIYSLFILYVLLNHEPWFDEVQAWQIARNANNLLELWLNFNKEGHTFLWFFQLYIVSFFTNDFAYVQYLHLVTAILTAALILFVSPFSKTEKFAFLFSYYLLYEYTIISRCYGSGVLLAVLFLITHFNKNSSYLLKLALLFLMANTSVYGCMLSFGFGVLMLTNQNNFWSDNGTLLIFYLFTTIIVFVQIQGSIGVAKHFPDTISERIGLLPLSVSCFVRAFFVFPDFSNISSWNTTWFINKEHGIFAVFISLIVAVFLFSYYKITSSASRYLFLIQSGLIVLFILLFPMPQYRHFGYLFVAFMLSYWLLKNQSVTDSKYFPVFKILFYFLSTGSIFSGIYTAYSDIKYPFSNSKNIAQFIGDNNLENSEFYCSNVLAMPGIVLRTNNKVYLPGYVSKTAIVAWDSIRYTTIEDIRNDVSVLANKINSPVLVIHNDKGDSLLRNDSHWQFLAEFDECINRDEKQYMYIYSAK